MLRVLLAVIAVERAWSSGVDGDTKDVQFCSAEEYDPGLRRKLPDDMLPTHSFVTASLPPVGGLPQPSPCVFPDYNKASGTLHILGPGDVLLLPQFHWHWVFSNGSPTIAVNIWSINPYLNVSEPTVRRGAAAEWDLAALLLDDFLDETQIDSQDIVAVCGIHDHVYPEDVIAGAHENLNLQQFSNRVKSGDKCYGMFKMTSGCPFIARHTTFSLPESPECNVWVSSGGHFQSGLHYDDSFNSLAVLQGQKAVLVFPPSDSKHLSPAFPWEGGDFNARMKAISAYLDKFDNERGRP